MKEKIGKNLYEPQLRQIHLQSRDCKNKKKTQSEVCKINLFSIDKQKRTCKLIAKIS